MGPCSLSPSGTLAVGKGCVEDGQCASGSCSAGSGALDGGAVACETCVAAVPIGQPCTGACVTGAICSFSGGSNNTCVAQTTSAAGGKCDGDTQICASGLTCVNGTCAAPGATGAACSGSYDCQSPLACVQGAIGAMSTCQTAHPAGAPCLGDSDCASGLGCDPTAHTCATVTWVAAGQACTALVRCLTGYCPYVNGQYTGVCPTVIPDGQPCDETSSATTSDWFASCFNGACSALGASACP